MTFSLPVSDPSAADQGCHRRGLILLDLDFRGEDEEVHLEEDVDAEDPLVARQGVLLAVEALVDSSKDLSN